MVPASRVVHRSDLVITIAFSVSIAIAGYLAATETLLSTEETRRLLVTWAAAVLALFTLSYRRSRSVAQVLLTIVTLSIFALPLLLVTLGDGKSSAIPLALALLLWTGMAISLVVPRTSGPERLLAAIVCCWTFLTTALLLTKTPLLPSNIAPKAVIEGIILVRSSLSWGFLLLSAAIAISRAFRFPFPQLPSIRMPEIPAPWEYMPSFVALLVAPIVRTANIVLLFLSWLLDAIWKLLAIAIVYARRGGRCWALLLARALLQSRAWLEISRIMLSFLLCLLVILFLQVATGIVYSYLWEPGWVPALQLLGSASATSVTVVLLLGFLAALLELRWSEALQTFEAAVYSAAHLSLAGGILYFVARFLPIVGFGAGIPGPYVSLTWAAAALAGGLLLLARRVNAT